MQRSQLISKSGWGDSIRKPFTAFRLLRCVFCPPNKRSALSITSFVFSNPFTTLSKKPCAFSSSAGKTPNKMDKPITNHFFLIFSSFDPSNSPIRMIYIFCSRLATYNKKAWELYLLLIPHPRPSHCLLYKDKQRESPRCIVCHMHSCVFWTHEAQLYKLHGHLPLPCLLVQFKFCEV